MEKAADMVRVIRDPKTASNEICNTGTRPSIAGISMSLGTTEKHIGEPLPILKGQLAGPTRSRRGCKALDSSAMKAD